MKKEKTYKFNEYGLAQVKLDIQAEKSKRFNKCSGVAILLLMMACGLAGKEYTIFYIINLGIDTLVDIFTN